MAHTHHDIAHSGRAPAAGATTHGGSGYQALRPSGRPPSDPGDGAERINTVVIGGGQAGLSVGYHLSRCGIPFVILDANERIGHPWRERWDSLRLFTPARFNGLDGMRFPLGGHTFPTKDEMADYLESYAAHFELPVRTGHRVTRLSRVGDRFLVETAHGVLLAENVVVAMANFQVPKVPDFAADLDPKVVQIHSRDYRGPEQVTRGPVLVVGAGNSGAEIAMELSRSHPVQLAGRHPGHVPIRLEWQASRFVIPVLFRLVFHRLLSVMTPIGRKVRRKVLTIGGPLVRVKPKDMAAAGIERVPRMKGVSNGKPMLDDGRVLDVANVVWCTGFHAGFSWIELPVLGDFEPIHERGVVPTEPGLFFVGLHFLTAFSSVMIHGLGRDARYVVKKIAQRRGRAARAVRAGEATT